LFGKNPLIVVTSFVLAHLVESRNAYFKGISALRPAGQSDLDLPVPPLGPQPRRLLLVVGALTVLVACGPWLPGLQVFKTSSDYLPLHTGIEFISMAVSFMVFGLGWNLRRQSGNSHGIVLAATFLSVALLDFAHTLSFDGMPDVFGPSGPEKAINFWLIGRAIAAIGLVAVVWLPVRTWSARLCVATMAGAVVISFASWWIGFFHSAWLPRTFVAGQGLTPFKINSEYALAATYFAVALVLVGRGAQRRDVNLYWLAAGAWVLGLSELFFTLYGHVTDLFNLLGHVYKAVAYVMLYRALFVAGVLAPHRFLRQKETELKYLAQHDSLTGLPNRLLLVSRLEHAVARTRRIGGQGAFLFLDLDHFKNVNDSLGHGAGDELLQLVAERLQGRLRNTDLLARMGGDEFVVLMEQIARPEAAASVALSLIEALKEVFVLAGGHEVYIGTSVGICIFPNDSEAVDQIIRNADAALYQAKGGGRGVFRFYTEALTVAANARVEMESALRRGLQRGEFMLHYQPLVAMADCRIVGVEALVRWSPPGGEMIAAARFIPVAEETGLIIPLGEWVLRAACAQMKLWLDNGIVLDTMAVNLSPHQFGRPNIHDTIGGILAETGLPACYLELEITEGSLMESGSDVERKLNALKALGVRLAIDDFGTGYSSLAYLKRFPVDKLKVDQSFVRDIPDNRTGMEITAAVVGLGRALNLEVLAEGVETEIQLAHLRQLGCDTAQGYLLARPMPASDIVDLVSGSVASLQMVSRFRNALQLADAGVIESAELLSIRIQRY
jgi:diguanylate cyclase (GGDEF)-like protein